MPAKQHNFTRTEIVAGLFVAASIAVLVGFVVVIQGEGVPEQHKRYYARFSNILGMKPAAIVRYGGVQVGEVTGIQPDPKDQSRILVEATVRAGVPVNAKSVATIEQLSLTAERHLEISTGEKEAEAVKDGGDIESLDKSGSFVDIPDLDGIVKRTEDLLDDVIEMFGVDEAKEKEAQGEGEFLKVPDIVNDLKATMEEGKGALSDLRATLADNRPNIDKLMDQANTLGDDATKLLDQLNGVLEENRATIKSGLENLDKVLEDAAAITDSVAKDIEKLVDTLQSLLDNADGLAGTARDFLDDNRLEIEAMLGDLRDTLRYLKSLAQTLSNQPQAVIRGKAPEGRK